MACRKCGSDWTTATGKDCKTCPACCKQQRCKARKEGKWVEPTAEKLCRICKQAFIAVGLHDIKNQHVCLNPECKKTNRRRIVKASKEKRAAGVFTLPREPKPQRHCKRLCCGKLLTRRDQKDYCSRTCAGADAREYQRGFRGFAASVRQAAAFAGSLIEWDWSRPMRPLKPKPNCMLCQKPTQDAEHKFCSRTCMQSWRGERPCDKCGRVMPKASWCTTVCLDCRKDSARISRRKNKSNFRRRARKHGVEYTPIKRLDVYVRDGWKCQLCGKMCRKKWAVSKLSGIPHPRCATIDHIVPMSRGGGHVMHNVQLACWECNTRKGARLEGQRLLPMS